MSKPKLTLAELAAAKGFTPGLLAQYGVRNGQGGVVIPYYDGAGNEYIKYRIRSGLDSHNGFRWSVGDADLIPYGLHRPVPYTKGFVWIVEGESDCWALWSHGMPALGLPGATIIKPLRAAYLSDVESVGVIQEPGEAGGRFPHCVAQKLYDDGFAGAVYAIELPEKDPRELMLADPENFKLNLVKAYGNRKLIQRPSVALPLTPSLGIKRLSSYTPEVVTWLWNQRIPAGKISILAGDGGEGKSFVTLAIAAAITTGASLPGGSITNLGDVVIWNGEDAPEDTLYPRAQACGANLDRLHILEDAQVDGQRQAFGLRHVPLLCDYLEKNPAISLVVIDPISALLAEVDGHKDTNVRGALQPLVDMAKLSHVAILMVMHLNKNESHGTALHRINGSTAFGALARSVLYAGTHAITGQKSIDCIKHNLAKGSPDPVEFSIGESGVEWHGTNIDLSAAAIFNSKLRANRGSQGTGAVEFLRELLARGPVESAQIFKLADERGIAERTLKRAKEQLGVRAKKHGIGEGSRWFWSLADENGYEEGQWPSSKDDKESHTGTDGRLQSVPLAPFEGCQKSAMGSGTLRQSSSESASSAESEEPDLLLKYADEVFGGSVA